MINRGKRHRIWLVMAWSLLGSLLAFGPAIASADTWTSAFVPTRVQSSDLSGTLYEFIGSGETLVNPAGCPVTDVYATNDTIIMNQALATALSAIASGAPIIVLVSSTACAESRPEIIGIEVD